MKRARERLVTSRRNTARWNSPDPEHARQVVAEMSEQQVRDVLTGLGSTTAATRPDAENRAFLAQILGTLPFQVQEIPKDDCDEVTP